MSYFVFGTVHNKILNKTIFKNGDMIISSYFPMSPYHMEQN